MSAIVQINLDPKYKIIRHETFVVIIQKQKYMMTIELLKGYPPGVATDRTSGFINPGRISGRGHEKGSTTCNALRKYEFPCAV